MILIAAEQEDVHARRVRDLLEARGHAVSFIHGSEFGVAQSLTFDPVTGEGVVKSQDEGLLRTADISAVWYRRPGRTRADPAVTDSLDRAFAEAEWQHALDGFFSMLPVPVVSPPFRQRAAIKPRQLAAARRAGLRTPQTIITNDVEAAVAFVASHERVIHKAMSVAPHRLLDTREWGAREEDYLRDVQLCPIVLQEEIVGPGDVRVTIVGRRLFAALIQRTERYTGPDSRLDLDAPCEPHELPDEVSSALLGVMDALGLVFGTADLKLTPEGDYVFFEVNPQGQFLYIEILTGQPISMAVADLLIEAA